MKASIENMESHKERSSRQKTEKLFELFPHVGCDEVKDIFSQLSENLHEATATLEMIYGKKPDDESLREQF